MNSKRMIAVFVILAMALAAFAAVPVDEGDAFSGKGIETIDLRGDFSSEMTYTSEQTVVVAENLNIINGGSITIEGVFIVSEGATVTISGDNGGTGTGFSSSELVISGNAVINGSIVSKAAGGLRIEPELYCEAIVNGAVSANGDSSGIPADTVRIVSGDGKATVNGTVVISYNAIAFIDGAVFSEGSEFRVLGEAVTADGGSVRLSGKAYFDGAAHSSSGAFTIGLDSPAAVVEAESLTGAVTVTDSGMLAYSYGGAEYFIGQDTESNVKKKALLYDPEDRSFLEIFPSSVTLCNITNIMVGADVDTFIRHDPSCSQEKAVADERMTVAARDAQRTVGAAASGAAITLGDESAVGGNGRALHLGSMDLYEVDIRTIGSDGVTSACTSNIVTVSGEITSKRAGISVGHDSVLNVEGLIVTDREIVLASQDGSAGINAAYFSQRDSKNNYTYYYTTLSGAIDMDAGSISMVGCMHVTESISIPSPVRLTTDPDSDPSVEIGSGATLRIEEGAKFVNTNGIIVNGQFVNENYDQGYSGDLTAEIRTEDGSSAVYSDVFAAVSGSGPGDVLRAYGPAGSTILVDADLTVPADVTLDCRGYAVEVENGCTLIVKGRLIVSDPEDLRSRASGSSQDNGWNIRTPAAAADGTVKSYSVLSVEAGGSVEIGDGVSGQTEPFRSSGAYYNEDDNGTKGRTVFTSVENAFAAIPDAYENRVTVFGDVTIGSDVSGTEKKRITIDISEGSKVTMSGFTFSYGTVNVPEGVRLTGDIGTSGGRIAFSGAAVLGDTVFSDSFVGGAMTLEVTGAIGSNDVTGVSGTVCLNSFTHTVDPTDPAVIPTLAFDKKRMLVQAGSRVTVMGNTSFGDVELLVAGDMTVTRGASLEATWVSVTGTLTAAKTDGAAGLVSADYLCVGRSTDSFKGAEAIVNGSATVAGKGMFDISGLSGMFVFSGATVTADVLVSWTEDKAAGTAYHINGALWLTAYQGPNGDVRVNDLVPANAGRSGITWMTYDEKSKKYIDNVSDGTAVGARGFENVYAEMSSTVYGITVTADEGIDSVSIDGRSMTKTGTPGIFKASVPEGMHSITYTPAQGYSGTASILSINGIPVEDGGLEFTADMEGTVDYIMEIALGGIHKSGDASGGPDAVTIILISVAAIAAILIAVVYSRRAKD